MEDKYLYEYAKQELAEISNGDKPFAFTMDNGYIEKNVADKTNRHVYNCFINSAVNTDNNKNRQFSSIDMFPTTLAALGCTVSSDRLALGTNLFSNKKTLIEEYGFEYVNNEFAKASHFYVKNLS